MTDAASLSAANTPREVIQRRLVGLSVLLLAVFLLSLLLRNGGPAADALPAVVIPLNGDPTAVNAKVPVLGGEMVAPTLDENRQPAPEPAAGPTPKPVEQAQRLPKPLPKPAPSAAKVASEKPAISKTPAPKPQAGSAKPAQSTRWFVVVGAYKDPIAAEAIANRIRLSGFKADTVDVTTGGERFNRVRSGPFGSREQAESARATLIVEGLTKAVIVGEP